MIRKHDQPIEETIFERGELNSYSLANFDDTLSLDTCIFCGCANGNIDFKGRCVCEDCLTFVKDLM